MKKNFFFSLLCSLMLFSPPVFAVFCNTGGSLVSVKKSKSGRTEYVVFTVKLPYVQTPAVSTATPPFIHDASGNTVTINGCKYKKIVFNGVEWTCSVREYWNPTTLIRQVKSTGQFEGIISYVVGYKCSPKSSFAFYSYTTGAYQKYVMRFRY